MGVNEWLAVVYAVSLVVLAAVFAIVRKARLVVLLHHQPADVHLGRLAGVRADQSELVAGVADRVLAVLHAAACGCDGPDAGSDGRVPSVRRSAELEVRHECGVRPFGVGWLRVHGLFGNLRPVVCRDRARAGRRLRRTGCGPWSQQAHAFGDRPFRQLNIDAGRRGAPKMGRHCSLRVIWYTLQAFLCNKLTQEESHVIFGLILAIAGAMVLAAVLRRGMQRGHSFYAALYKAMALAMPYSMLLDETGLFGASVRLIGLLAGGPVIGVAIAALSHGNLWPRTVGEQESFIKSNMLTLLVLTPLFAIMAWWIQQAWLDAVLLVVGALVAVWPLYKWRQSLRQPTQA